MCRRRSTALQAWIPARAVAEAAALRAQVWALKSYTKSAPLYVQVLQRSSLGLISPFLDPDRDVIVSVEQTRHRLLALSCLCPGASTLIGAGLLPALKATSALCWQLQGQRTQCV